MEKWGEYDKIVMKILYDKKWELHHPARWLMVHNEFQIVKEINFIDQIFDGFANISNLNQTFYTLSNTYFENGYYNEQYFVQES